MSKNLEYQAKKKKERVVNTKPSLALKAYEGTYANKMLGTATVTLDNDKLQIDFNDFVNYYMEHWHYDTFMTNKDTRFRQKIMVRFELNTDAKIAAFDLMGNLFTKSE